MNAMSVAGQTRVFGHATVGSDLQDLAVCTYQITLGHADGRETSEALEARDDFEAEQLTRLRVLFDRDVRWATGLRDGRTCFATGKS